MKLFDDFEAIKFPEENLIFITHSEYLYYIYDYKYKHWSKYQNAGNDHITVCNYPDVSEQELKKALGGIFPEKETDFMRCCNPSELHSENLFDLLEEDYSSYMSDYNINKFVLKFLCKSNIPYKSYLKLKELFDNAIALKSDNEQVFTQIKKRSFDIIGRDILQLRYSEHLWLQQHLLRLRHFHLSLLRVVLLH